MIASVQPGSLYAWPAKPEKRPAERMIVLALSLTPHGCGDKPDAIVRDALGRLIRLSAFAPVSYIIGTPAEYEADQCHVERIGQWAEAYPLPKTSP